MFKSFQKKLDSNPSIYNFTYYNGLKNKTSFHSTSFCIDGFDVYVTGSLFSTKIDNLEENLRVGLNELQKRFEKTDLPILDRMKASIFQSGDYLAEYLHSKGFEIDDVDYSVCIIAFEEDIMYVWIDGGLNIRLYRADQSILLDEANKSQFNGSTQVLLGDILIVGYTEDLEQHDDNFESYVLDKAEPDYPALCIDFQVEFESDESQANDMQVEPNYEDNELESSEIDQSTVSQSENPRTKIPAGIRNNNLIQKIEGIVEILKQKYREIEQSQVFKNIAGTLKYLGLYIWNFLLRISSFAVDFLYTFVLRKNQHQLKRFQNSYKKKYIQYFVIAFVGIFGLYFLFLRGNGGGSSNKSSLANDGKNIDENAIKTEIQNEFNLTQNYFQATNVVEFTASHTRLKDLVSKAQDRNFSDQAFLQEKLTIAQEWEDRLFNVAGIDKAVKKYTADQTNSPNLVDFDVLNGNIYALDTQNSLVLISDSSTGTDTLIPFSSDSSYTALKFIECYDIKCYLLDEQKGLVSLDLTTKIFTSFHGSESISKGVQDFEAFEIGGILRLYTLVPSEAKVYRYDQSGDVFNGPIAWNQTPSSFGAGTVEIGIDGSIYELMNSGALRTFYGGSLNTEISGLAPVSPVLSQNLAFDLTPVREAGSTRKDRFFIADSENNYIAVFDKTPVNGIYPFKGFYKYRGPDVISFDNFKKISYDEGSDLLYILESNYIYSINISKL